MAWPTDTCALQELRKQIADLGVGKGQPGPRAVQPSPHTRPRSSRSAYTVSCGRVGRRSNGCGDRLGNGSPLPEHTVGARAWTDATSCPGPTATATLSGGGGSSEAAQESPNEGGCLRVLPSHGCIAGAVGAFGQDDDANAVWSRTGGG